jgi:ubiquinone/menaquinone biosynthesis C-methylase UbiE
MVWDRGWDKIFSQHSWGRYPAEDLIRFVAREFGNVTERDRVRILEVGCGTGANLWYLAREGFSTYGLDGSSVALQAASERLKEEGLAAEIAHGDAMALPYPDGFFDAVLDHECLYANTKPDTEVIISEVDRVLKPGGKLFSRTFAVGTYGYGMGVRVEGEPHTFRDLQGGALKAGYGVVRFTAEDELTDLYSPLVIESYEYLTRSIDERRHQICEWLVVAAKSGVSAVRD